MFLTYLFYIFQTLEIVSYEIKLTYQKDSLDFQRQVTLLNSIE